MRIKKLQLKAFKRFHDLTIDLETNSRKIVALVGPNGSGKSSVFDSFEEFSTHERSRRKNTLSYRKNVVYYLRSLLGINSKRDEYDMYEHVFIDSDQSTYIDTSFYIRSAYRFTPRLDQKEIKELPKVEEDEKRPKYLIDVDNRLEENYSRLIGNFFDEVFNVEVTGKAWASTNIQKLNDSLKGVLDVTVSHLGNPTKGKGSLYFKKGTIEEFPYENLSAGEKEVVDIIIDLHIKKDFYKNSVICIDEPELHLNTKIQRKLLTEIEKIISDDSQLWIATHSVGFLRALQSDLPDKTTVVDFTGSNFDEVVILKPVEGTRKDWNRMFETALEDLSGLLAPENVIYCEGREDAGPNGEELGLDALIYNEVFAATHSNTLFVSSGGGGAHKNASLALKVLEKAFDKVNLYLLKDMDTLTHAEREEQLEKDKVRRILKRREIENYLFDKEVLKKYCESESKVFDEARYDVIVTDVIKQDLKPVQQHIQSCCKLDKNINEFKISLAKFITPETLIYKELEKIIF